VMHDGVARVAGHVEHFHASTFLRQALDQFAPALLTS
jgi:hypothetical protein